MHIIFSRLSRQVIAIFILDHTFVKQNIFVSKSEFSYSFHSLPTLRRSQRKLLEVGLAWS